MSTNYEKQEKLHCSKHHKIKIMTGSALPCVVRITVGSLPSKPFQTLHMLLLQSYRVKSKLNKEFRKIKIKQIMKYCCDSIHWTKKSEIFPCVAPVGTLAKFILGCAKKLKTEIENFEIYL